MTRSKQQYSDADGRDAAIVRLVRQGYGVNRIRKAMHCTNGAVHEACRRAGIAHPGRRRPGDPVVELTPEQIAARAEVIRMGWYPPGCYVGEDEDDRP